MEDDVPNGPRRRVLLRRGRNGGGSGGFSSGALTVSRSMRASEEEAEHDEVDDAINPEVVDSRIRRGMVPPPTAPQPPASPSDPERDNPRQRLNQVAMAGSSAYAKEYRLSLLHRLLMRRVPLDQIASQLQVSISTVEKDRAELKKRLREAAKLMDIDEMIGGQQEVYDEIAGMSLRVASGDAPLPMKLAAMRTALAANADRVRFLNTAGVFDVLRFRRAEDGAAVSDVQMLMQRTMEMMQALNEEEGVSGSGSPPRRSGGFDPMTFDDAGASRGDNEVQEL